MTRRLIRAAAVALPLVLAASLAACASSPAPSDASGASGDPITGGTLTYLEHQTFTNLYPPQAGFYPNGGVVNNITARLTWQNPDSLEIEPWIASDWTVNDDATEYTFNLKPDVTFSDGTPVDAAAVAKNFDTYGLGDPERGLTVSEAINNYASSEVVDDDTVTFRFSAPAPGFLQATSTINSGLLSPETLDGTIEDFGAGNAEAIIGAGPFTVTDEKLGTEFTLTAREDYAWAPESAENQGRPYLDAVHVLVTPEDSVRIGSLLAGQADYVRYVQAFDEDRVESAGFTLYAPQTRGVNNSIALRPENPLLTDIRVRQALVAAVDAQEVVDTLFTENYPVATSVLSQEALGYKDESEHYAYDPEKAEKLLDEAGWEPGSDGIREKDGERLAITVYEAAPQPLSKQTLELVAQQLAKVGVELTVKPADAGSYAEDTRDPLKTGFYHSMVGRADFDVIKSQYYTKNRDVLISNDAELDALLEAVASEPDTEKRVEASQAVQDYIAEQAYVIPLFEEPQVYGAATYVHGVDFESVGRPTFSGVWLAEH
ncbi:TIGR04028 family ABC transporter substrate-binding protein [Microbacterium phyllosphaerae]|uniref:TIGR04028 family ABC transporter substrate-binding protein n=1 Tax=Microbacterium phyllosphaerae TaxID=124798 RepID=UPI002169EEBD|nr:TIGR04028 family ABC transporter substrate-binding protein [Microbacterium phyllosphaerae]MCS3443692.1 peptide/nickel transport system substrate-binding protein [Microbacterium phyllosphaerae]